LVHAEQAYELARDKGEIDMQTLLVAVDGSKTGNRAVAHAIEVARRRGDTKLLLVNVQETLEHWHSGGLLNKDTLAQLKQLGEKDAAAARALVDAAGLDYEFKVLFGRPGEVIARLALEPGCIGIVMGTRGLSDMAQVFLGSTAHKVVQLAEVPVTLVK
jgi:nucleotide-binding universal stress UspA family protein